MVDGSCTLSTAANVGVVSNSKIFSVRAVSSPARKNPKKHSAAAAHSIQPSKSLNSGDNHTSFNMANIGGMIGRWDLSN